MAVANINPLLLKKSMLQKIHLAYKDSSNSLSDVSDIKIRQLPFKTVQIFNVFQNTEFVKSLAEEISEIELEDKSSDLYRLQQSQDLNNLELGPYSKKFVSVLKTKILKAFNLIFGVKLKRAISITVSKYKKGDYLLCHDDKCENRHLAFVLYLSNIKWKTEDGGLLSLFSHDKESKQPTSEEVQLLPIFNSMILFEVDTITYHQVTEVIANKVRWSINGWFHSDEALTIQNLDYNYISGQVLSVDGENVKYDHVINNTYLKSTTIKKISRKFKTNKAVALSTFVENKFYSDCLEELKSRSLTWEEVGPANHRKYYTASFSLDEPNRHLPPNLSFLVSVFCSPNFAAYISNITKKRLIQDDGSSRNPLSIEIQRWTKGCYTLLADNDVFQSLNFVDVILFFSSRTIACIDDTGGILTYVNGVEEGRTLTPASNSFVISDYDENTKKFTNYIDSKSRGEYYSIAVSFLAEKIESK